jgi:dehydrogenase/reductase SDR family protein 12
MKKAVTELKNRLSQIDVFVHNGGCMLHERLYTQDKIEKNFATNIFAVYYLTILCLELLQPTSRTISVSSGGCLTQELETEDIFMEKEDFDGTTQYARNKRQQLCLMEEFGKMYASKGLFVSMHPGWSDTPSVREAMPDFYEKMKDKLKTSEEGADTILWLSLCK